MHHAAEAVSGQFQTFGHENIWLSYTGTDRALCPKHVGEKRVENLNCDFARDRVFLEQLWILEQTSLL